MDKKQTAVEWLMSRFESGDMYNVEDAQFIKHQALKMEKEQMQKLIIWMYKVSADQPMRFETDIDDIVEQYYNETYGEHK